MPEENQPNATGGAAELMRRMARMVGEAELLPLTVQRYYALDFKSAVVSETQPESPKERLLTSPN
jgi:hypothetical protein